MEKESARSSLDWIELLKVLADETRLYIISELLKQELSVNEIADALGLKAYNVSRHLKIMETRGLVEKRKEGLNRIYRITEDIRSRVSEDNQGLDLGCCKFEFGLLKK